MSYLSSVLQMKPSTWDSTPLPEGKNYSLITLKTSSSEYENVETVLKIKIKGIKIEKINRVQHPFAYGRFLLRKEQLQLRKNRNLETKQVFIKVDEKKLPVFLEYNLDNRRKSRVRFEDLTISSSKSKCLVIAKCLKPSYLSIKSDSEIYPEYVVYYEANND